MVVSGLARRLSMATRWGGGTVVVRAGESLVHGEGSQRIDAVRTTRSEALMNIGESLWPDPVGAARRVRQMQCKLHQWAVGDPGRRFDDVFNLVYHPDFLTVAWERVAGNKGARTAGVDRVSPASIAEGAEVVEFLEQVRLCVRTTNTGWATSSGSCSTTRFVARRSGPPFVTPSWPRNCRRPGGGYGAGTGG